MKLYDSRTTLLKKLGIFLTSRELHWSIIFVGIVLRLIQYLLNRSLWIDESFIALNIINKSFPELLQPLDYNQAAPVGFLILEKLAVQIFGGSEYALRLVPFLSGIISLFLFYRIAIWFSKPQAVTIALGLFAISDRLIYYSSEVKQYSSDVAIALLLFLAIINITSKKLTTSRVIFFGIIGAISVWFSHPSVFILAGTGISLILFDIGKKEKLRFIKYLIIYLFWLLSFTSFYFISLRSLTTNEYLLNSWSNNHNAFMPFPPFSSTELRWFADTFFEVFNNPVGIHLSGIAALTFIIGCVSKFADEKKKFCILISPLLVTLFASGLEKYPFEGQLLLFIVPFVLLLVAEGTRYFITQTRHNSSIIGIILVLLLFFHPLQSAVLNLKNPQNSPHPFQRVREEIKPVLSYVRENRQNGDVIYLYYASQYAFKYYLERYGLNYEDGKQAVWAVPPKAWFAPALPSYPPYFIVGKYSRDNWKIFISELNGLYGNKRVWLIFSHVRDRRSDIDEEDMFLHHLNTIGKQLDYFKSTEASAYLYDLSKEPKTEEQ